MTAEEQSALLDLMSALLFRNFDYHLLDPEKLLLAKVLNQFELIEKCLTR